MRARSVDRQLAEPDLLKSFEEAGATRVCIRLATAAEPEMAADLECIAEAVLR